MEVDKSNPWKLQESRIQGMDTWPWTIWLLYFQFWVLWGVLGFYIAGQRGIGQRTGFLVGLLLGPFGVTILALVPVRAGVAVSTSVPTSGMRSASTVALSRMCLFDAKEFTCWRCKQ